MLLVYRVLQGNGKMEGDIGSPEQKEAVNRGFRQWIQTHGFDDLSMNVGIYSLSNRLVC